MSNIWSRLINLAGNITGILGPANGGTGIANNAASTLAISGAFATTMTVSNTTAVTLPTAGTLLANSRNINTTAPITGGGDLSADRTIAISAASTTAGTVSYEAATSFTATLTGVSGSVTQTFYYSRVGNSVVLTNGDNDFTGTSTTTACSITGIPAAITPTRNQYTVGRVSDAGVNLMRIVSITTGSTLVLYSDLSGATTGFTATGVKGLRGFVFCYLMT